MSPFNQRSPEHRTPQGWHRSDIPDRRRALAVQLAVVRPRLTRRSDRILAATTRRAHYAYVGSETVKALALLITSILVFTSRHYEHWRGARNLAAKATRARRRR